MKTKLCRPVLIDSEELSNIVQILPDTISYTTTPNIPEGEYKQLILISLDPDEKIENGDMYIRYHNNNDRVGKYIFTSPIEWCHKYKYRKVIAFSDKSINAPFGGQDIFDFPLIPDSYIHQFIEEYNKGEVKNVEINMEYVNKPMSDLFLIQIPLIINGCVDIIQNK